MTNYKLNSLEESMARLGLSEKDVDQSMPADMWMVEEDELEDDESDEDEDEELDEDEDEGIALLTLLEKKATGRRRPGGKVAKKAKFILDPETGKKTTPEKLEKKNLEKWLEANPGKSKADYNREKKAARLAAKRRPKHRRKRTRAQRRKLQMKREKAGVAHDTSAQAEPTGVDRLDLLMSQLESLSGAKKVASKVAAGSKSLDEDHTRLIRIYGNIAAIADELAGRIEESHELHGKFDELADDALKIGEALRDGKINIEKAAEAVNGYVQDLVEAMGPVAGELEEELNFDEDEDGE